MQTSTKLVGSAGLGLAACAACCAVSVLPAVAVGSSLVALGGVVATWGTAALLVAIPLASGVYFMTRRPRSAAKATAPTLNALRSAPTDGCGCETCDTSAQETPAIACSLDAGDFKLRTAGIRDLANRSLRRASRTRQTLSLTYGLEALAEVRDLVRKEEDCCAFLAFDLHHDPRGVYLTITAPEAAAEAADMLFDHFAPDAAKDNQLETA